MGVVPWERIQLRLSRVVYDRRGGRGQGLLQLCGSADVSDEQGISVFCKNEKGEVFHTYSCHGRGIDMVNGAYQFLNLVPKGRDEDGFKFSMEWLRRHDQY